MDTDRGIEEFLSLLARFESSDARKTFLNWIQSNIEDLKPVIPEEYALQEIAAEIRNLVPFDAQLSSENIQPSHVGPNSDCNAANSLHLDAFLYNDDMVDALVEEGKLSRTYCKQCGSKDTVPLNFISHSASIPRLRIIFKEILPDLTGKIVLDIGSRLGAVLYGAYYFSNASKILGVEINADLVQLQQQLVVNKGLSDRIEVIHNDICQRTDLLKAANVILMNNVFEFFVPHDVQSEIWRFLRREIPSGTLLVTMPSLEESLTPLKTGIDLTSWVREVPPCRPSSDNTDDDEESEISEVKLYQVL